LNMDTSHLINIPIFL